MDQLEKLKQLFVTYYQGATKVWTAGVKDLTISASGSTEHEAITNCVAALIKQSTK